MDNARIIGKYTLQCLDENGAVKWEEGFDNLVTDQGKKYMLDQALVALGTTVQYRVMLFTAGTPGATSTYSVPIVTEVTSAVMGGTRPLFASGWNAAGGSAGSCFKASNGNAVFTALSAGTITGAGIVALPSATIGNLALPGDSATANAVLYSVGTFTSKSVAANDVLNVTYTTILS